MPAQNQISSHENFNNNFKFKKFILFLFIKSKLQGTQKSTKAEQKK